MGEGAVMTLLPFLMLMVGQLVPPADLIGVLLTLIQGASALWLLHGQSPKVEPQRHRLVPTRVAVPSPLLAFAEPRVAVYVPVLITTVFSGPVHQLVQQVVMGSLGAMMEPMETEGPVPR